MHRDLLHQAYSAMRHDLRRTLLTMAGMAWGMAPVVLLLSYGNGFGKAIQTIFESFGATAVGVFPGRTSQQAGGNKAGVQIRFTSDDIELLRNNIPLCRHVVRMSNKDSTVQNGNRSFTFPVTGLDPAIEEIWHLDMEEGRFIDDADNMRHGLYAVIGSEARDKLFSGMSAVEDSIRINGVTFQIIGVVKPRMQEGDSDDNRTIYIPFNSMDVIKDNHYLDGIWLDSQGLNHDKLTRTIRETLGAAHSFKPDDQRAVFVFDAQKQLSQFGIITMALKVLLAFIGTVTLGIGGVGLMNIMLVSVTQRTPEIGGEKPRGDRRRRRARNSALLYRFSFRRPPHPLQRHGQTRRSRRHPTHRLAHDSAHRHHDSGDRRSDQRHGPSHARRQPRSDRSPPLRITTLLVLLSLGQEPCAANHHANCRKRFPPTP